MTKKKRELIEILLDNVKPEDWPERLPYAAQDKKNGMLDLYVWFYKKEPSCTNSLTCKRWIETPMSNESQYSGFPLTELCKNWNKTIVHRDEFMNRWNERNGPVELKTPQRLALEKFGTDWHENEGSCPVCDDVVIEVTHENGVKSDPVNKASEWSWKSLTGGWTIAKWRVNSETNATTPPEQQEHNTEETKPIQQEVKATDTQVGGDHYTKLAIQPMRYSMENGLDALQHTVIKYVTRFRDKAGIEDLEKAKHCIDMLIEYEKESK